MQCPEFQAVMSRFIDGDIDKKTRKQVALHLADCEDCLHLIEQDSFWDKAVLDLLDREAPADLRAEILGDLADTKAAGDLDWKKQMKIIGWAATRKSSPRQWWETVVLVAGIIILVQVINALLN